MDASPSPVEEKPPQSYVFSSKVMLGAIVSIFTVFFFILLLHLYVRWHVIHRPSRRASLARRRRLVFASAQQGQVPQYANQGLDTSILVSLPVTLFTSDADEEDEFVECAVCLNGFTEGEKIRGLPQCGHRFHIDCIDMWLYSHTTCPLCRAAIEGPKEVDPLDADGILAIDDEASSVTMERPEEEDAASSSCHSGDREVRIEMPVGRGEGIRNQEQRFCLESTAHQPLKTGSSPTVLIRWNLTREPGLDPCRSSGSVVDLERGDGADTPPSPRAPSG